MKYRTLANAETGDLDAYIPSRGGATCLILEYSTNDKLWESKLEMRIVKEGAWFPVEVEVLEDGTII